MKKTVSQKSNLYFLFAFCFFMGLLGIRMQAVAQNLDSLLALLPKQKNDTNKVLLLNEIVIENSFNGFDKQEPYIKAMYELSKMLRYPHGEALAYRHYAILYGDLADWDKAMDYTHRADSIYSLYHDEVGLAFVNFYTGNYYMSVGRYEEALVKLQQSHAYYERMGSNSGQAITLGTIASLLDKMDRYKESETYRLKSFYFYKEDNNIRGMALSMSNLGVLHNGLKNYEKALFFFKKCLELEKDQNDLSIIANCKYNIANVYVKIARYNEALKILNECYYLYAELQDTIGMGYIKLREAEAYRRNGNPDQALVFIKMGTKLVEHQNLTDAEKGEYDWEYYQIYKAQGNYQLALEYYENYITSQDGIFSVETNNKISELKEKYETEKKDQENLVLKANNQVKDLQLDQQKYLIYGMIAMILFILVIAVLLVRFTRIQHQQKNMALEQKLLRSRMNPHFIFNALLAIQSFMFENEPREAGKFLSAFARLMRAILENASGERVLLSKEIKWLEDYIQLQQLRFDGSFEYTIHIDLKLSTESLFVPPMLFQPFIENAIEHGLSKREQGGLLTVNFSWVNESIQVEIQDNGTGFSITQKGEGKHVSLATAITQERLFLINRRKRKKIHFSISSAQGAGTQVLFNIPAINEF